MNATVLQAANFQFLLDTYTINCDELRWAGAKFIENEETAGYTIIRPDFTTWFNSRKGLEFRTKQGIN